MLDVLWAVTGWIILISYFVMTIVYFSKAVHCHQIGDTYERDWSLLWLTANVIGTIGMAYILFN